MNKTLYVEIKSVYGKEMVYPACDKSKTLARIAGTTTLTREVIAEIKSLGFDITVKTPVL